MGSRAGDTHFPSHLMLGRFGRKLHVVAADHPAAAETIVITTYEPEPKEWEADLKNRRKP